MESFQERRGVIFAKQFNIGEELPNGKTKQWVCSRADGAPVAMAVIFNEWETVSGRLRAFAMVTTASCPPLAAKDERMPALLCDDEDVATWLGETGATDAELNALLRPYEGSLVMREQEPSKKDGLPPKPRKAKPELQPELF
jgi:putative SOS response-associated peptidase YedK